MIRSWVESHLSNLRNRLSKGFNSGKGGITAQLRGQWIELLYVIAIVIMAAGTVNAVIQPVNPGYVIFPSSGDQSATETVVDAFVLLLGAAGVYLSYLSGRQTTRSRMVNFFLLFGLLLIVSAIYIGIYVLTAKQ